ncbi:MAG: pyridoxal phosphate-dependent aminotransferase [Halobacteriaceae archaeon]
MFPRLEYLEWIEGRPEAALHDLGGSDLRGGRETGAVLPDPVAERPEPPAGVTLETLLATIYGVEPEQVLVTAGASHANFLAAATALEHGGGDGEATHGVVVEEPGYEPLVKTPAALGGDVTRFARPAAEQWAVEPDRVAETIDGDTALVTITNRHNPSGRLAGRETLSEIAEAVAEVDGRLLVDEVYAPYGQTRDGQKSAFGGVTAAGLPNSVVTSSLTKFLGLGDVRIGWLIADAAFVDRARSVLAHVPAVAATSRAMACRVLYDREPVLTEARSLAVDHAAALERFVADRPALSGPVFDGASYGFLVHDQLGGDELADRAAKAGVLVVPGRFFDAPERIRVSLGRDRTDTTAALAALGEVLDASV